jgi:hypothetical protein
MTPASRQIQVAFASLILTPLGLNVLLDRTPDEAIQPSERPCVALRLGDQQFEFYDQSTTSVKMDLNLDIFEDTKGAGSQADRSAVVSANIVAAVHADRTLGGRLQDLEEAGIQAGGSDLTDLRNDVLVYQATFFVPRGDMFTIIGQSNRFT